MRLWPLWFLCFVALAPAPAAAQQVTFADVKIRTSKSATDRLLVNKSADLVIDDGARRLTVKSKVRPLDIAYDDVQRIVFDQSEHMKGGDSWGGGLLGGLLSAAAASEHVTDYWCHLEYKGADGATLPYMLLTSEKSATGLIEKMKSLFADKVVITEFAERDSAIDKQTLKELANKYEVRADKEKRPLPELRADKALVVVVCPTLKPAEAGKGNLFRFFANGQVVAINKEGTYCFAYLDPGEYQLVSQTENTSAIRMMLEAGKDYYFTQGIFMGMGAPRTRLSRHSRELVMYEVSGSYYSNWKPK